jgi:hypothetical protein
VKQIIIGQGIYCRTGRHSNCSWLCASISSDARPALF